MQADNEEIKKYAVALCKLATNRRYGAFLDDALPQCFVQYPLPKVEDIFASLAGGKRFSKLDLKDAYLQMVMSDESMRLLTINSHKRGFRYNRLVFGVASAPALWQRAMDQVLRG